MIVGAPCESYPGERRVALVPAIIPNLTKAGLEVVIEAGAGTPAGYLDAESGAVGLGTPGRPQVHRLCNHRRCLSRRYCRSPVRW